MSTKKGMEQYFFRCREGISKRHEFTNIVCDCRVVREKTKTPKNIPKLL